MFRYFTPKQDLLSLVDELRNTYPGEEGGDVLSSEDAMAARVSMNFLAAQELFNTLYAPDKSATDKRYLVPARIATFTLHGSNPLDQLPTQDNYKHPVIYVDGAPLHILKQTSIASIKAMRNLKVLVAYVKNSEEIEFVTNAMSTGNNSNALVLFVTAEDNKLDIPSSVSLDLKKDDTMTSFYLRLIEKSNSIASLSLFKSRSDYYTEDLEKFYSDLIIFLVAAKHKPELNKIVPTIRAALGSDITKMIDNIDNVEKSSDAQINKTSFSSGDQTKMGGSQIQMFGASNLDKEEACKSAEWVEALTSLPDEVFSQDIKARIGQKL